MCQWRFSLHSKFSIRGKMKEKSEEYYGEWLEVFQDITKTPIKILQADEKFIIEIKDNLQKFYNFVKLQEIKSAKLNTLRQLVVENFDLEQIWQQIELQNNASITPALTDVTRLVVNRAKLQFRNEEKPTPVEDDNDNLELSSDAEEEAVEEEANDDDTIDEDLNDVGSDQDNETQENEREGNTKRSVVDDYFFKLHEMEKFLQNEEAKMDKPDSGNSSEDSEPEESVDLFEAGSDDDKEMELAKYKDFFVKKDETRKTPQNKFLEELEESDELGPSAYELKQDRLNKGIKEIEEEAIDEKSWQLKGEITAEGRPQNSLLAEVVDFDVSSRPAPVITEQTTLQLEDIIKQRIKVKVFDSVEKKSSPTETPLEYKKKLVLDQEKSKESLAQIYEKEFVQQQELLSQDKAEVEEKEPELHQEINSLMSNLFNKLDALSNYFFTPKPAVPELRAVSNLPAITKEEVAPVATSDAALLAPQEIKTKSKGDIVGKGERTKTDKKRERRKKKLKQKIHAKEKEKMQKGTTGNKMASKAMTKKHKKSKDKIPTTEVQAVKSSKAFFSQMDEKVKSGVKRKSLDTNLHSAKRLKL